MSSSSSSVSSWLIGVFYGVVAIGLLAPMASNSVIPTPIDHRNHTAIIVQARMALAEGQFPLRVASWEHNGWGYAMFQFYSPLPYTVAGLVHMLITPENPFLAYKLTLWAALTFAGIGMYLCAGWLTRSRVVALLAGLFYMSAPYMTINVSVRGAFTEAVGQAIVPLVLYGSLRAFATPGVSAWPLLAGVAWAALALTHNITFALTAAFGGLWFVILSVRRWRIEPGLWRVGFAFALGCLLAVYFLVPVLRAPTYLNVRHEIGDVFYNSWMTPISTLLAPVSLPPEPASVHPFTEHLNPGVGWPMLIGVAIVLAAMRSPDRIEELFPPGARRVMVGLLVIFGLALFLAWSPFDFWSPLPHAFGIAQFPYRFLSQVTLAGTLLVAYALVLLFPRGIDLPAAIATGLLIVLAHSSYLPALKFSGYTNEAIVKMPTVGYSSDAYLPDVDALPPNQDLGGRLALSALYPAGRLLFGRPITVPREVFRGANNVMLLIQGQGDTPGMNGDELILSIDGCEIARKPAAEGGNTLWFPFPVDADSPSPNVELQLDVTHGPRSPWPVVFSAGKVWLLGLRPPNTLTHPDLLLNCVRLHGDLSCHVNVKEPTSVQVPQIYYPDLLDFTVDGKPVAYFPTIDYKVLLAGTRLEPGAHDLRVRFRGVAWANWLSVLAWIGTFGVLTAFGIRRGLRPRSDLLQ